MIGSHHRKFCNSSAIVSYRRFDSMWSSLITVPRCSSSPAGLTLLKLKPHLIQPDEPDQRVSLSTTLNHIWVKLLFNNLTLTRRPHFCYQSMTVRLPSISMIVIIFSQTCKLSISTFTEKQCNRFNLAHMLTHHTVTNGLLSSDPRSFASRNHCWCYRNPSSMYSVMCGVSVSRHSVPVISLCTLLTVWKESVSNSDECKPTF